MNEPITLNIPIADIAANEYQPRTVFDEAPLNELAASIKEHGIQQPLVVTTLPTAPDGFSYMLLIGERRLRAAQMAGLTSVPCLVKHDITPQQCLELALIENLQREDLHPADEARAYQRLHDEFGLTDEQIGQRVGKSRPTVTITRNLAKLPEAVINRIGEGEGQLPKRTVRQLLPLAQAVQPDQLIAIADDITSLKPDDRETPEDVIFEALNRNAHRLPRKGDGWDLTWPGKPIDYTPPATQERGEPEGGITIPACRGCPFMVTARSGYQGGDFCVNARCFEAKTRLFADHELARIIKKTGIPSVADGETAHVLDIDYRTEARAQMDR